MRSRIAATIILLAGIGALLWVALGGDNTESATEALTIAAPTSSPITTDPSAAADSAGADDEAPVQADAAQAEARPEPTATPAPVVEAPENFGPRMDLVEIDGWLNTDATSIDDFNGQVVLVEMWTFGCSNCKARIPFNQSYYEEFGDENFEIVGVHAPEFSFEADVNNIIEAAERLGVDWPIALDTKKKNFRAWQPGSTNFWPRTYVIDQNGDIRYDHIGEGKYEELRETIRYLIENPPAPNPAS
jgi:thiol-disulfide isomerase/thioredoxin